jgi:hypothetical protein
MATTEGRTSLVLSRWANKYAGERLTGSTLATVRRIAQRILAKAVLVGASQLVYTVNYSDARGATRRVHDEMQHGQRAGENRSRDDGCRCGYDRFCRIERASAAAADGVLPTCTPAASSASFFAAAVPEEPDTIAPAWPIVLPSGAVNPAT